MSDHLKGLLLTILGVMVLSPDTLLIRLVDIDQWSLLVMRGLLMAAGMAIFSKFYDAASLRRQFYSIGKVGIFVAFCFMASTIAFVNAIIYTTVAHTLVIVATAPLFSALFARLYLGERLKLHTLLAIIFVIVGMVLVVGQKNMGQAYWLGNFCALLSAVFISITFVLNRKNKHMNMIPAISLGGIFTAVFALPFAAPIVQWSALDLQSIGIILLMGLVVSLAFALITLGPRYIPAAEVSLILPLETVGGTALAWWALHEVPSNQTLFGAALILLTLMVHSYFSLRREAS